MKATTTLLAVFSAAAISITSQAASMPEEIRTQFADHLPAAFVPIPASGGNKIFPMVSEKRSSLDRKYAIKVDGTPFAIMSINEKGTAVEMSVPAGLHTEEFTNRWFKAEDVFGKIRWKLEPHTNNVPSLAYFSGGKGPLDLVAKIPAGTLCASFGTIVAAKAKRRLLQVRITKTASGQEVPYMLVFAKENPPVETQAEYDARAKHLMSEHAFRNGRPWGKRSPSLLGNNSCFECAAMAADFATYMFDGSLNSGERFEKADEIRSGDVIRMEGHYFAVIYRKGSQLTTIEGNMNKSVHKSTSHYSVKNGKLMSGGKDAKFEYGYHNWTPDKKANKK